MPNLFIAIDNYHGSAVRRVEASSVEEAAELATSPRTVRPLHIVKKDKSTFHVMDDVSHEGWGPGCKYEGKNTNTLGMDHFWLICLDGDPDLKIVE